MSPWIILSWVVAIATALVVSALAVLLVVSFVRSMFRPRSKTIYYGSPRE